MAALSQGASLPLRSSSVIAALHLGTVLCLAASDPPCGGIEHNAGAPKRGRLKKEEGMIEEGPLYGELLRSLVHG